MDDRDLELEIQRLKKERNAVLLAHYYQESEIQDVADFIGDSLQLAQAAKKTTADVICFAGVHFMAETAKILNPDRIVVRARHDGGLLARRRLPGRPLRARGARENPGDVVVVSYINCSAEVKARERLHLHVVERREDRARASPRTRRSSSRPTRTSAAGSRRRSAGR